MQWRSTKASAVNEVDTSQPVRLKNYFRVEQRHRLALWSRRLLGEAITQAQFVLADHDELVDLVLASGEGLTQMTEFFDRLQRTHNSRMQELGLA